MWLVRARARVAVVVQLTVASLSVALLVSGCHVPGTAAASTDAAGGQTITVAVVPGVSNAPLYVAARDGLFSQHGLHVVIKSSPTLNPVIQALRSGRAQIAAGDYTNFLYEPQTRGGVPLSLIADGYDATQNMTEVLALPDSHITTPQDLRGKTVATPEPQLIPDGANGIRPYDIETLATQAVLQSDGVSPTGVRWQPTPAQDMISELKTGQVNAILATEPYVFEAESKLGAQEVLDTNSGVAAGLPQAGYFCLASYARSQPAVIREFRAALLQAQADSTARGPAQALLPHSAGIGTTAAALITLGTYPTVLSLGQVQRVAQLMFEGGMTDSLLSIHRIMIP